MRSSRTRKSKPREIWADLRCLFGSLLRDAVAHLSGCRSDLSLRRYNLRKIDSVEGQSPATGHYQNVIAIIMDGADAIISHA